MVHRHSKGKPDLDLEKIVIDADNGDADAQNILGWIYHTGDYVPQDDIKATDYYKRAALQGNATAQNNLMLGYLKGSGVPKDYGKAAYWAIKGARGGNLNCQRALVQRYLKSQGVPYSPAKAYAWCIVAKNNGDLWRNLLFRFLLKLTLTKAELIEARGLALDWEAHRVGGLAEDDVVT